MHLARRMHKEVDEHAYAENTPSANIKAVPPVINAYI